MRSRISSHHPDTLHSHSGRAVFFPLFIEPDVPRLRRLNLTFQILATFGSGIFNIDSTWLLLRRSIERQRFREQFVGKFIALFSFSK